MQRLFLVRHGPTHAKGMIGWTDLPADLSDKAALTRLHDFLPGEARVVSSDLTRTIETAHAILGARRRLPHEQDLREMHFGDWENRTFKEISAVAPDAVRDFYEQPGDHATPNGECWHHPRPLVSPKVDALLQQDPADLIIVCHFGVVLNQLQRATGFTAYDTFAQKIDNLSVTEILVEHGKWTPGVINHCP